MNINTAKTDGDPFMGTCVHHPDRETSYLCMKHNVYLCESCLQCRDPELYCKFRQSCPIWFIHKERRREARQQAERDAGASQGAVSS